MACRTGAAAGTRKQCPTPDHARPIRRLGDLLVRLLTIAEGIPSIAGHPDYLTAADTAALLRITPDSLDTLRHRGEGPPGIRLGKGGLRFYRRDVEEWRRARLEGRPGGRG